MSRKRIGRERTSCIGRIAIATAVLAMLVIFIVGLVKAV